MKYFVFYLLIVISGCNKSSSTEAVTAGFEVTLQALKVQSKVPALGAAFIQADREDITVVGEKISGATAPFTARDSFHLGSCSKSMTATVAAILIEEELLSWDSKLGQLLPDLQLHPEFQNATFEMLLSHRCGVAADGAESFAGDWLFKALQSPILSPTDGRKLYTQKLLELKPQSVPGSRFNYHNGGYIIASFIMEELTGQEWENLIRTKLFDPLKMASCGTGPTWGHYKSGSTIIPVKADNPPSHNSASGVHCAMEDWAKYLREHLKGLKNEDGIIRAESFKKLHTISANDGQNYTFGGWVKLKRDWANGPVYYHNGSNTWNYAQVWIAPNRDAIILSATNMGGKEAEVATDEALAEVIKRNL